MTKANAQKALVIDATLLAELPADAELTVTVRAGDLRRAMEMQPGGPAWVTTSWCAQELGFSARQWRQWCEEGEIEGAVKDSSGRWRLPNRGAREHFARTLHARQAIATPAPPARVAKAGELRLSESPGDRPGNRRKRRGPWKTLAGGEP